MTGWLVPIAIWAVVIGGARGWILRLGLARCRAGDWGLALLLGYSGYTGAVYLGALAGIPIRAPLLLAAAGLVGIGGIVAGIGRRYPARPPEPAWTPAEKVLLGALAVYGWFATVNGLYHPVVAEDAFSYAGRGLFLAVDGTLDIGRYHWGPPMSRSSNLTYPPFHSLAFATTYLFGGWQPKIVVVLFSLGWPLILYDPLRRALPRFAALAWMLLLALTPEVFSHASYALLNVPAMALIAGETVCLARFVQGDGRRWLIPAAVCAAGAGGVRSDAVAPHLAVILVTLGHLVIAPQGAWSRSRWRSWAPGLAVVAVAPLLTWGTWTWYLGHVIGIQGGSPFQGDRIGWGIMLRAFPFFLFHFYTFGPVFLLWAVSLPLAAIYGRRHREAIFHTTATAAVLITLLTVYANLGLEFGGGPNDVINSSFKRAVFYLVPPAGLAAALSPPWRRLAWAGRGWVHASPGPEGGAS